MQAHTLWYTKKGEEIRGPFPKAVIGSYLLLGRLHKHDYVSLDKTKWIAISEVDELIPEVMKADLTDVDNLDRFNAAVRAADERLAIDRRGDSNKVVKGEERRSSERRAEEPEELLKYREAKTRVRLATRKEHNTSNIPMVIVVIVIIGIFIGVAIRYQPPEEGTVMDCSALPGPSINWSNCDMAGSKVIDRNLKASLIRNANLSNSNFAGSDFSGSDLAFSDFSLSDLSDTKFNEAQLMGAKLRSAILLRADLGNADLSYADLWGADIRNVNLSGAKLDNAVWIDKRICAPGSVGQCIPIVQ